MSLSISEFQTCAAIPPLSTALQVGGILGTEDASYSEFNRRRRRQRRSTSTARLPRGMSQLAMTGTLLDPWFSRAAGVLVDVSAVAAMCPDRVQDRQRRAQLPFSVPDLPPERPVSSYDRPGGYIRACMLAELAQKHLRLLTENISKGDYTVHNQPVMPTHEVEGKGPVKSALIGQAMIGGIGHVLLGDGGVGPYVVRILSRCVRLAITSN